MIRRLPSSRLGLVLSFALPAWGASVGCEKPTPLTVSEVDSSAQTEPSARDVAKPRSSAPERIADAEADADTTNASYVRAVRSQDWSLAARLMDALPDAERDKPHVRYTRARVAIELGDAPLAEKLLLGLEAKLPALADDIALRRAHAETLSGDSPRAAEVLSSRKDAASLLRAARAYEKMGNKEAAGKTLERIFGTKHTREEEAAARALRVRVADRPGRVELLDIRWLLTSGADLPEAEEAARWLAKHDPNTPLTSRELIERAKTLGKYMKVEQALAALDLVPKAMGPKVEPAELARERGYLLYRARTQYPEAAKLLSESARKGGPHAAEDAFYAARALSRADKDQEAMAAYRAVAKRYTGTPWADRATYYVPYLQMLHSDFTRAARGFDDYAKRFPTGQEIRDANRYRAISHLMAKNYKVARGLFEKLAVEDKNPSIAARYANLGALAALREGDRPTAIARWTEIARNHPLSYAALVARARLRSLPSAVPAPIEPAEGGGADPLAIELPSPVDLLVRLGFDGDAEALMRQHEGPLGAIGGANRETEALCAGYGKMDRGKRRYQISLGLPRSLLAKAPGPRNRWAWNCAYPRPYAPIIADAESRDGLPKGLLWSIMKQESAFDPTALSPARAVGLLQLLPETAREVAKSSNLPFPEGSLTSPAINISLGAAYLKGLLARFDGRVPLAAAAYNAGPEAIARWVSRSKDMELDVFVERIPYRETREYVAHVLGNMARYGYLDGSDSGVPDLDLSLPAIKAP